MRVHIEIDDRLMQQAMSCSGARTKKTAVEKGLRLLVQVHGQTAIRRLRGKVRFWTDPVSDQTLDGRPPGEL